MKKPVLRVVLTEHERGWGSKEFHAEYFKMTDYEKAKKYSDNVNEENTEFSAPDYYITASEPVVFEIESDRYDSIFSSVS